MHVRVSKGEARVMRSLHEVFKREKNADTEGFEPSIVVKIAVLPETSRRVARARYRAARAGTGGAARVKDPTCVVGAPPLLPLLPSTKGALDALRLPLPLFLSVLTSWLSVLAQRLGSLASCIDFLSREKLEIEKMSEEENGPNRDAVPTDKVVSHMLIKTSNCLNRGRVASHS